MYHLSKLMENGSLHHITQLKMNDSFVTDPLSVAEALASHYVSVSSNNNYDNSFLSQKLISEKS